MVVLLALGVPLALNLNQRATLELRTEALVNAQAVASTVGAENLRRGGGSQLHQIVNQAAPQVGGRVIVVDRAGTLVADSAGSSKLGQTYRTPGRPEIGSALRGTPSTVIRYSADLGTDLMVAAVPIMDEGKTIGAVRISETMAEVRSQTRRSVLELVAIGLVGLAVGLGLAYAIAGSLTRPLRRLTATAERLGEGDLSARSEGVGGTQEVAQLARSFDEMADRVERTVRSQREFVANASHQLRTPLTGIKLRIESAAEETDDEYVREQLQAADREVDRLSEIVARLLITARQIEEAEPSAVGVGDAVARAVARWDERAKQRGASLSARGEDGEARGNASDLDQILDNLLDNAISYAPGEIEVESGASDGRVFVAVRDHGSGIGSGDLDRVTERFYRGRGAPPGGSGLGLAIARELAEKWGGTLTVSGADGGGTRVEVDLPAFAPTGSSPLPPLSVPGPTLGR